MTSHTGARSQMRQECLFLLRFLSFVQFLFSSQFLLPALIRDFAGATRTKLLQVAKNERMFLLFLIDLQKAWLSGPCQQNRE